MKKSFTPLLAIGLLCATSSSFADKEVSMEKCMGIVTAGMGDGKAAIDGNDEEWLYLPFGQCEKLIGGDVYIEKK